MSFTRPLDPAIAPSSILADDGLRNPVIRRFLLATLAAWLVFAAVILGRFADDVFPAAYLLRPMAAALLLAAVLGVVSLVAAGYAPAVSAGLALMVGVPTPATALSMVAALLGLAFLRRRGRWAGQGESAALVLAFSFFALGAIRALPVIHVPAPSAETVGEGERGVPMVLFLLDGYPRSDTLDSLGIDNSAFIARLEERGFEHYPAAHSLNRSTHRTLQAMLTDDEVTDTPVNVEELREIHWRLPVPAGFVAVDPPIGFVTLGSGRHLAPGGPNDFEADLLGRSIIGTVFPDTGWALLLSGMRAGLDSALDLATATDAPRVFVHLMVPHRPFLYGPGGTTDLQRRCWPECQVFADSMQDMGITREQWTEGMAAQLEAIHPRLLDAIDQILAGKPTAVIVLFSDHGGRMDEADRDEWHRSFLAARTPGHPGLFADAPRPDTVIRKLLEAYGTD
jgi:hypothetical protein